MWKQNELDKIFTILQEHEKRISVLEGKKNKRTGATHRLGV
jgi:hypothetical protein